MNEMPSRTDSSQFDTSDEVGKIIILIVGWYIAIFEGVLFQVFEAQPVVRAVIGILLVSLISNSAPHKDHNRDINYQNVVYWVEIIIITLTFLFGFLMFAASIEEITGIPIGSP
jgi:hypothetical protein